MLFCPTVLLSDAGARGLLSRSRRRSAVPARPSGSLDPDTRAWKLARLERLRREVATLELELNLGGPDGTEPAARAIPENGSVCNASDGSASDVCTSDEDSCDVDFSD